jgi:hypothetical protein
MPLPSHGIGSNYGRKRTPAPCGYSSLAILSRFSQLPNDASKTTGDQDCALSLERPRCRVKSSLIADLPIRPRSLKRDSAVHFQAVVQTSLRNGVVESVQNGGGGGGAGLECYFLQDSNDTKFKELTQSISSEGRLSSTFRECITPSRRFRGFSDPSK